jgi:phage replication-related protein YjqB (UPF0714/DUF867 family)
VFGELIRQPGVVEECVLRSEVGFLALHGGSLERGTAELAAAAADHGGASLYAIRQPEDLRWHIPSHLADPATVPRLAEFLAHVEVVVSLHGYGRPDLRDTLLVGGANRGLAATTAAALRDALPRWPVVDDLDAIPLGLRGLHPSNPVNLPRGGGVQIELPPRLRDGECAGDRERFVSALAALPCMPVP